MVAVGPLPAKPSLEQLRKRAKQLRDDARAGRMNTYKNVCEARELARELHPRWAGATTGWERFSLADAQLVVARAHGFSSWRRLREHVEMIVRYGRSPQRRSGQGAGLVDEFLRLACLTYCGAWRVSAGEEADDPRRQAEARRLLAAHPELGSASIHTAAAVGDLAAARSWLARDGSLANQEGGPHGWPPLLYLALSRLDSTETLEVARLLLAHGADPNAGYLPDGEPPPVTALSGAFRGRSDPVNQPPHQHSLALARLLLDAGADPNDEQAVRNACGFPHDGDAGLALLLEHGLGRISNGPWQARRGPWRSALTPAKLVQGELRYAAEWNLVNRARLLLRRCAEAGIDLDARGGGPDPCQTAYEYAVVCGNTEIVDLLTQAGAQNPPLEPTYQLVAACLRVDRVAVDRLLADDSGLVERTLRVSWWPEPVHQAGLLNRPEAVKLLVSLGFPVNDGKPTPLHTAALAGHLDVVRLLVELGADPAAEAAVDTPGQESRTPLDWARYNHQHEVAAYLARLR